MNGGTSSRWRCSDSTQTRKSDYAASSSSRSSYSGVKSSTFTPSALASFAAVSKVGSLLPCHKPEMPVCEIPEARESCDWFKFARAAATRSFSAKVAIITPLS